MFAFLSHQSQHNSRVMPKATKKKRATSKKTTTPVDREVITIVHEWEAATHFYAIEMDFLHAVELQWLHEHPSSCISDTHSMAWSILNKITHNRQPPKRGALAVPPGCFTRRIYHLWELR